MFVPMSERGYDELIAFGERYGENRDGYYEQCRELELPECGYWLDVSASGVFVMRTAERVALGCFIDGQLIEVHGPVEAP